MTSKVLPTYAIGSLGLAIGLCFAVDQSSIQWHADIYDFKERLLTKRNGGPLVPAAIDLSRAGGSAFILQLRYGNRRERRLLINR